MAAPAPDPIIAINQQIVTIATAQFAEPVTNET
jgi:hypothetical protein